MKKNIVLIGVVFLIVISILIGGTLSIIDNIQDDTGCKIVKKGNVCDKYTKCEYDSVRDISCIKGYEIISEDIPPSSILNINIMGGSQ
jgi:uncharacterized protein YxeA